MPKLIGPQTRLQSVGLRPEGNTVTVELASDNPFEMETPVEVYTQCSGGIAPADAEMRSSGVLTPVMHGPDAAFPISGLAADAPAAAPAAPPQQSFWQSNQGQAVFNTALSAAQSLGQAAIGGMAARQQAKAAEIAARGQAQVLEAQARAEQAAAMRAEADRMRLLAGKKPFPTVPVLIGVGVLALVVGGIFLFKKGPSNG